jgi:hypothetical protein
MSPNGFTSRPEAGEYAGRLSYSRNEKGDEIGAEARRQFNLFFTAYREVLSVSHRAELHALQFD